MHPEADRVEVEALHWLTSHQLICDPAELNRYSASKFGHLVSRVSPYAETDALVATTCLYLWLFIFDDVVFDEANPSPAAVLRTMPKYLRIIETPTEPVDEQDPFAVALRDIRIRMGALCGPVQLGRLLHGLRDYFFGAAWQCAHWQDSSRPSLAEYQYMRPLEGAMYYAFAVMQITDRIRVPDEELWREDVQALTRMAANVVVWQNDICSHFKEVQRNRAEPIGLPSLLTDDGTRLQDAFNRAAQLHNDEIRAYVSLEPTALAGVGPECARYLEGLRTWMRGNHDWELSSGRYEVAARFSSTASLVPTSSLTA